jgi:hypothetical protein
MQSETQLVYENKYVLLHTARDFGCGKSEEDKAVKPYELDIVVFAVITIYSQTLC